MVDQTPVTIRDCFDAHGYSTGTGRSGTRSTYGVIRTICGDAGHYGAVDKVCFQKYGLAKSLSNSIYLIVNNNKQARKTYLLFR
ncbi:hypothetical protein NE547_01870 [Flavonifractor sp. DFI.6.63]|uniref:hypothetical protein n=1 Tax=Flavonifractor sp. DFI.6.63 TaxID=2963704 RepID=UPI00210B3DB3|nr:hypothetical protein [Flavonifractor sp. DFI.6.63]MCQ5028285.1 hypothetical protein [Flavonifractor sp. DFI.6.63]